MIYALSQYVWTYITWNSLIAISLVGLIFFFRRQSWLQTRPELQRWLWVGVLLKLAIPPLFDLPVLSEQVAFVEPVDRQQVVSSASEMLQTATIESARPESSFVTDDASTEFREHDPIPSSSIAPSAPEWQAEESFATSAAPMESGRPPLVTSSDAFRDDNVPTLSPRSNAATAVISAIGPHQIARVFATIWLVVSVAFACWVLRQMFLCKRFLAHCWISDSLSAMAVEIARTERLRRTSQVLVSPVACSPALVGFLRPVIVISEATHQELTEEELAAVLAHELTHYQRRDHLVTLMALMIRTFMWWNPISWLAFRELRHSQELACDAQVLAGSISRSAYARALWSVISQADRQVPVISLSMATPSSRVAERFQMLKSRHMPTGRLPYVGLAIAMLLMQLQLVSARSTAQASSERRTADTTVDNEKLEKPVSARLQKRHNIPTGQHLFTERGCNKCHEVYRDREDYSQRPYIQKPFARFRDSSDGSPFYGAFWNSEREVYVRPENVPADSPPHLFGRFNVTKWPIKTRTFDDDYFRESVLDETKCIVVGAEFERKPREFKEPTSAETESLLAYVKSLSDSPDLAAPYSDDIRSSDAAVLRRVNAIFARFGGMTGTDAGGVNGGAMTDPTGARNHQILLTNIPPAPLLRDVERELTKLQRPFDLWVWGNSDIDEGFIKMMANSQLDQLLLSAEDCPPETFRFLAPLKDQLKALEISVSPEDAEELGQVLAPFEQLRSLRLTGYSNQLLQNVARLPRLQRLSVSLPTRSQDYEDMAYESLNTETIDSLSQSTTLQNLVLRVPREDDTSILPLGKIQPLRRLELPVTRIQDSVELAQLGHVTKLVLAINTEDTEGVLQSLSVHPALSVLSLSGSREIQDEDMLSLLPLADQLDLLDLQGCPNVTSWAFHGQDKARELSVVSRHFIPQSDAEWGAVKKLIKLGLDCSSSDWPPRPSLVLTQRWSGSAGDLASLSKIKNCASLTIEAPLDRESVVQISESLPKDISLYWRANANLSEADIGDLASGRPDAQQIP
ncbi:MAG: M56 family metallopeptidase [Planctomycetota bacterium]